MEGRKLTTRQQQVIALVARGDSNGEIAHELGITEDGVKAHLSRLYLRFGVTNRVALLAALDRTDLSTRAPVASLADLRAIAAQSRERSDAYRATGPLGAPTGPLAAAREALAAVDVALDLVRELPPETSGPVLDVLRKRVAAAVAALDFVQGTEQVPAV